jgi:hypothetical protein
MSPQAVRDIQRETELIQRFTETYSRKFSTLIADMNAEPRKPVDEQCLRLCVEAVDMMLATQSQLAAALSQISSKGEGADSGADRKAA